MPPQNQFPSFFKKCIHVLYHPSLLYNSQHKVFILNYTDG